MDNMIPKGSARRGHPAPRISAAHRTTALAGLALFLVFCGDPSTQSPPADVAPHAIFTANCTNLECSFIDGSTDADGAIVSRLWDYGDDTPLNAEPSHSYATEGTYRVTLSVTDDDGAGDTVAHDVMVGAPDPSPPPANTPPKAGFTFSCTLLTCSFTDASTDSDGSITSRGWDFGDGATSTTLNPTHSFASGGTYSVRLTVTDNGGASNSASHDATVASTDVVLIGAGDIAGCGSGYQDEATSAIIAKYPTATVYTVGDNAYPDGTTPDFNDCYAPSWGKFKSRTRPAPGNHEYHTSGAAPYYTYFGSVAGPAGRGYYSYNLGNWHIISLNSEIDASASSAQATWLKQDLAANPAKCTIAYWHKPLFTSAAKHLGDTSMQPFFTILYDAGAEIVLGGHNHQYERFAPQRADGTRDGTTGVREFVVGTGGSGLYDFTTPMPNSEVRYKGFGVLKLTLKAASYDWEFLPIEGATFTDSGTGQCH